MFKWRWIRLLIMLTLSLFFAFRSYCFFLYFLTSYSCHYSCHSVPYMTCWNKRLLTSVVCILSYRLGQKISSKLLFISLVTLYFTAATTNCPELPDVSRISVVAHVLDHFYWWETSVDWEAVYLVTTSSTEFAGYTKRWIAWIVWIGWIVANVIIFR